MSGGIYMIKAPSGSCYVGSAKDLRRRWMKHRNELGTGAHHNAPLLAAVAKYGLDALEFKVIFECAADDLLAYEQAFIDGIKPAYNVCRVAGSRQGMKNKPENIEKTAASKRGVLMSEAQKAKLRQAWVARKARGDVVSDAGRERQRQAHLGKKKSPESVAKLSAARTGMKFSDEHRKAISEANKRRSPAARAKGVATRKANQIARGCTVLIPEQWRWFDHKTPDYDRAWTQRLEMLTRIRSGAVNLVALKEFYKDNPISFICDWGVTFDPRNIELNKPAMLPFILFERQAECIVWVLDCWRKREHGLIEKARDMGISWIFVGLFAHMFLFFDGFTGGMGSRKEIFVDDGDANPASLFWKLRSFIATLPVELRPDGWKPAVHATRMKTMNPANDASIVGEAGDGIGRGARTSLFLVDEAAFIPGAEGVDAALSQTTNCVMWASTVGGTGNLFHRKRHGGKVKVFIFDWRQDPRKDQAWYDTQVGKFDKAVIAAEIDRDYNASTTDSFIPGAPVTAALALGPADVMAMGPLMVGIDVARFGNDKCCFTARQGRVVYPQEVFGQCDVVDVAGRALTWLRTLPEIPAQIAVDTIGIGSGVADILRRDPVYGKLVVDVNSSLKLDDGENYNLRAYMWAAAKAWLKTRCSLPTTTDLGTELTSLRYKFSGSLLLIESKKEAKARGIKSPDCADSLALTFAIAPKQEELPPQAQAGWQVIDELAGY